MSAAALGLPRRTVRLRLTVLYGALSLLTGIGLLAITTALAGTWSSSGGASGGRASGSITSGSGSTGSAAGGGYSPAQFRAAQIAISRQVHASDSRQILIGALIALQLALTDPHPTLAGYRSTCEDVLAAGEQQEQLIEALLTLARSQRGLDHREPADLAEITRDVTAAAEPDAAGCSSRSSGCPPPARPTARGSASACPSWPPSPGRTGPRSWSSPARPGGLDVVVSFPACAAPGR
jgi:signal transduction histidine kinase